MAFDAGMAPNPVTSCGWQDDPEGVAVPGTTNPDGNYRIDQFGDTYYAKPAYHFLQQLIAQDSVYGGDGVGGSVPTATFPYYSAAIVSENLPATLGVNQRYDAKITVKN